MEGVHFTGSREAATSLMRWWHDAGVDTLVEDRPRDWLSRPAVAPAPVAQPAPVPAPARVPAPAPKVAALPESLDDLIAWMGESPDVPEARWGRTRILPTGDPKSDLMIIIEMPEPDDAEAGVLLAGEVGALFDRMLVAIGRDRQSVWLSPFATVRSVGRVSREIGHRLTHIARHQIELVAPRRLLIMGDLPNRALIGENWQDGRGSLQSINFGAVNVEAVSTFHPRLLHDRPAFKAQAWKDLQLLMKGL